MVGTTTRAPSAAGARAAGAIGTPPQPPRARGQNSASASQGGCVAGNGARLRRTGGDNRSGITKDEENEKR